MPEDDTAIAAAEDVMSPTFQSLLKRWPGTSELTGATLARLYPNRRFTLGWEIPAADLGLPEPLVVALERETPFQVPRIAVARRPVPREMPHLESDGVFCLLPSSTPVRLPITGDLAKYLVEEAVKVYSDALIGANRKDYLDEFGTYWTLDCAADRSVYVWLQDFMQTRTVYAVEMAKDVMVTDSVERVEDWMRKLGRHVKRRDIRRATFVRLKEPLYR